MLKRCLLSALWNAASRQVLTKEADCSSHMNHKLRKYICRTG